MYNAYADLEGYDCFGCGPRNEYGLKCKFIDEGDYVTCHWMPSDRYQGFSKVLHGGIQATLMDEIANWVIVARAKTAGVTTEMNVKYRKPVCTDKGEIWLRAKVINLSNRFATARVELFNAENELAAEAEITYMVFPEKIAREKFGWPGIDAFYKEKSKVENEV